MRIDVTQDDIDKGSRITPWNCAVARAVKREFPDTRVLVGTKDITFKQPLKWWQHFLPLHRPNTTISLSHEMRCWVWRFDMGRERVQPTSFYLSVINV